MTAQIVIPLVCTILSVLISLTAVFLNLKNTKRTDVKDIEANIEARVRENTTINMKLDTIKDDVAEIKDEIKLQRAELQNAVERIAKVEASCKRAHERLDEVVGHRRSAENN